MTIGNELCVSILDEIYHICYEHRVVFGDLDVIGKCYINTGVMGFRHIEPILKKLPLDVKESFDKDDLFVSHKQIWSPMNPKLDDSKWIMIVKK